MWRLTAIGVCLLAAACATASKETRFGIEDDSIWDRSKADGAAYAAEGFMARKTMAVRRPNDFKFFYKNCDPTDPRTPFSKTSYFCNEGPY
jgi:hypothetical protein